MVTVRILDRLEELGMSDAEFNQLHGWDKSFNQHRQHCLKLVTGRFQAGGGNARRQEKFYRALLDLAERRSETVDKSFIFRGTPDQPLVDAPEDHLSRALRGLGAEVNPDVLARARYAVAHYGRAQDFPEDSEERFTHLWKSFNALYSQARSTMATDATQRQLQSQLITRVVRRSPELVNRWGLACPDGIFFVFIMIIL